MDAKLQQIVEELPILASLPPQDAVDLLASLEMADVPAGAVFLREGEPGDTFFIVRAGEVDIIKALGTDHERHLATRTTGSVIGEMSLLNPDQPRSASARARTPVELLVMTRIEFETLIARYPAVSLDLLRRLSRRLRVADEIIIEDLRRKNRELDKAYAELKAAQEQIIEQEVLARELASAAQIQQRMLPQALPQLARIELGATMIPAHQVGGDFYDVIQLDETRLALVIGDVAGKGIPAALYMALVCTLVRAEARRTATPKEVLRAVNRELDAREMDGMFVTMLYGELDLTTGDFVYVRAGHDYPLIRTPTGALVQGEPARSVALGLLPVPLLDMQRLRLEPGSTVLFSTDGVTEAMDGDDKMFGRERLVALAQSLAGLPPQALCTSIVDAVMAYQGPANQFDDITLLALRLT